MKSWSDGVVESWSGGSMRTGPLLQYSDTPTPRRKFIWLALRAVLFALCVQAEPQQARKIPRVGLLWNTSRATNPFVNA
jgi:hypothetical protein